MDSIRAAKSDRCILTLCGPQDDKQIADCQGRRVMYVDDDEDLVVLIKRLLVRRGYDVICYTDPAAALQVFRSRPQYFDVVVTDLSMPGMSGFDLTRELFALRPELPILLTSGFLPAEDEQTARRIGIRDFVPKVKTPQELANMLDRLFREIQGEEQGLSGAE